MTATPEIVDRETWLEKRRALLVEEKAMTRQLDDLARQRRELPWVRLDKGYVFETSQGSRNLAELFQGRAQLAIYHFMMGPDWAEGCQSCSFWADGFNGIGEHLAARDTSFVAISRAPLDAINAYRTRMGWSFEWVSSLNTDFNMDFGVSFPDGYSGDASYNVRHVDESMEEVHGLSVLTRDVSGDIFHTYSTFARGADIFNAAYQILDLTPTGRGEAELDFSMSWVRRHDDYPSS